MATTRFHDHVRVLFKDHVVAVVEVENRNSGELGRGAARLWNNWWVHKMYQRLHNGVVCSVHVRAERKWTFPEAEKRGVSLWCDDPVLPAKPLETDVQHPTAAALLAGALEATANLGKLRAEWARRPTWARILRVKFLIRYTLLAVITVERDQKRTLFLRTVKAHKSGTRCVQFYSSKRFHRKLYTIVIFLFLGPRSTGRCDIKRLPTQFPASKHTRVQQLKYSCRLDNLESNRKCVNIRNRTQSFR